MKRTLIILSVLGLIFWTLTLSSCKEAEEVAEEIYTVTVTVYNGVSGTPVAGEYEHKAGDEINYNFSLLNGYTDLKVTLDGNERDPSGTVTVAHHHFLTAYAFKGTGELSLTVLTEEGVTGTPGQGYYYYNSGDQINYNFSLLNGYRNLSVRLDNILVEPTGTFTMTTNHVFTVYADIQYDIRGTWYVSEVYSDRSNFSVTLTFTGDLDSGTVTDSDGGSGTYTIDGNNVTFTLIFPQITYEYTGSFLNHQNMSGDSKRYTAADNYFTGEWIATKDNASAKSIKSTGKKGIK